MRAVCYSPVPVGADPDWFEPYGDYFTSNYAGILKEIFLSWPTPG